MTIRRRILMGAVALGACFLGALASARADVLVLSDGRILDRPKMERVEGGVKVTFENGEVVVPESLIQDAILEHEPPPVPKTPEEKEKAAKGLVRFEGKWVKPEKRRQIIEKRVAERRAYVEEIREISQWRFRLKEETKHFEFESTIAPHVFEHFRDLMEAYYKDFAKTWKIKQPKDLGKLKVCLYSDIGLFHQIGGIGGGVQGYFKFVKPLELNFFYDRLDPRHSEQVMYHEACHYLQLLLNPEFDTPHFVGESLAEYYGASKYHPETGKLETGLILEGRLAEIKNDVAAGDMMPLEKMMTTEKMYEHYSWGWSFAHFLMNDKQYRKKFEKFVKGVVHGKGINQVREGAGGMKTVRAKEMWTFFKSVMRLKDDEDVKALEAEWHAYVKDGLKFVTAAGVEKAAQSAARTGRPIKAKRLFKEAIAKGTTNPMTYYSFAQLLRGDEALALYRKAVELAPLEGRFYGALGRAMSSKDKVEAERLMKLAVELDPDNPYLELEIGKLLEEIGGS